jgi:hypothetical protein
MTPTNRNEDRTQRDCEPAAELSAEERKVLTRIQKQAGRKRSNALLWLLKNPPLFFWWWMY